MQHMEPAKIILYISYDCFTDKNRTYTIRCTKTATIGPNITAAKMEKHQRHFLRSTDLLATKAMVAA